MGDREGKECVVIDAVMSEEVVEEARKDETGQQKDFLCQLVLQYVGSKYKMKVDMKYKLPRFGGLCGGSW